MRRDKPSQTAMMVAFWRALGDRGFTNVPNFSDPAARKLLDGPIWSYFLRRADVSAARDPHGQRAQRSVQWLDGIILRVAFIDAVIAAAGARQVVILGAGLDTRAWRLEALRGAKVFEVDYPSTQRYKRERTPRLGAPVADVAFVAMDFARDDLGTALRAAGFDATVPTVWVWEGVIMYLDDSALRQTLAAIKSLSAPGSTLIAHYHEPEPGARPSLLRNAMFSLIGEPQIGLRTRDTMRDEITRAGFQLVEDAGIPEQAARVGAHDPGNIRLHVSRILVAT